VVYHVALFCLEGFIVIAGVFRKGIGCIINSEGCEFSILIFNLYLAVRKIASRDFAVTLSFLGCLTHPNVRQRSPNLVQGLLGPGHQMRVTTVTFD
jgi:hypothetical protein